MRYRFMVTEYDAKHRWLVVSNERRHVDLADGISFRQWADEQWPDPNIEVRLEPELPDWPDHS